MELLNEVVWPKFKGESRSIRVRVEMSVGFHSSVTCVDACTEAVVEAGGEVEIEVEVGGAS